MILKKLLHTLRIVHNSLDILYDYGKVFKKACVSSRKAFADFWPSAGPPLSRELPLCANPMLKEVNKPIEFHARWAAVWRHFILPDPLNELNSDELT